MATDSVEILYVVLTLIFGGVIVWMIVNSIHRMIEKKTHAAGIATAYLAVIPITIFSMPKVNSIVIRLLSLSVQTAQAEKKLSEINEMIASRQDELSAPRPGGSRLASSMSLTLDPDKEVLAMINLAKVNPNRAVQGNYNVIVPGRRVGEFFPDVAGFKKIPVDSFIIMSFIPRMPAGDKIPVQVYSPKDRTSAEVIIDASKFNFALSKLKSDPKVVPFSGIPRK